MSKTQTLEELLAQEAEAAELAEAAGDDHEPLPGHVTVTRGHGRSKTLQIRLNEDEYERLELIAKGQQLPVSTVARNVLLSAFAPADNVNVAVEQLEQALAQIRRVLAEK